MGLDGLLRIPLRSGIALAHLPKNSSLNCFLNGSCPLRVRVPFFYLQKQKEQVYDLLLFLGFAKWPQLQMIQPLLFQK